MSDQASTTYTPSADAEITDAIEFETFDRTLSPHDVATRLRIDELVHFPWWFLPIDTISPTRTVGKGRTNLTVIASDILQTDTTGTPYASFAFRQVPSGGPGVSVHFEPGAYGITATQSYLVEFLIATNGPVTLSVNGYAGAGTVTGNGTKTVNGNVAVVVGLQNVPAAHTTYASIQQTSAGGTWQWFRTVIERPPLVFEPSP
jgi:hypothetical protein